MEASAPLQKEEFVEPSLTDTVCSSVARYKASTVSTQRNTAMIR